MRWLAVLALAMLPPQAVACGDDGQACTIETGEYHIALPDGWQGGPAVIHLHGYGGSGAKVAANAGFVEGFTERGYALIAPTGQRWDGAETGPRDWSVRDGLYYARADVAFLHAVLDDAVSRHGIARDKVLMTGFSRGGSMTWEVACQAPGLAAAYAPASGGFWLPEVTACRGPVHLLHTHGFADPVVPLEGRRIPIDVGPIIQGDIWRGLTLWRGENGCRSNAADHRIDGPLWHKTWSCEEGWLELVLHGGGHSLPKGWSAMVLDWFEARPTP
ncbi:MAG: polyhydroxybutyrate depolymerase [Pseudomonadota bacterium]